MTKEQMITEILDSISENKRTEKLLKQEYTFAVKKIHDYIVNGNSNFIGKLFCKFNKKLI